MSPLTPKNKDELQEDAPLQELLVRQPIRGISKQNISDPSRNIWNVTEVNEYLSMLIRQGYQLLEAFNFGQDPDAYWVMYVLVKNG